MEDTDMTQALDTHVLALNRVWAPVHVTTARRALVLLADGAATALDDNYQMHDFTSWIDVSKAMHSGRRVHTPSTSILVPYVIVLSRYDRVPQRQPKLSRRNIFARDDGICQYCGKHTSNHELSIDHVVPRSRGGKSTWTNLVLACTRCNARKDNNTPSEAGMALLRKPIMPRWPFVGRPRVDRDGLDFWQHFISEAYWCTQLEP